MKRIAKVGLLLAILFTCIGCDQVTKNVARTRLVPKEPLSYAGGTIRLQFTENVGAVLGIGTDLPPAVRTGFLVGFNSLVMLALLWFVWRARTLSLSGLTGAALVIAGGTSNILDRLFNDGAVVDFINLGLGGVRTGIFNLADVAIVLGAGLLLIWRVRGGPGDRELESGP